MFSVLKNCFGNDVSSRGVYNTKILISAKTKKLMKSAAN